MDEDVVTALGHEVVRLSKTGAAIRAQFAAREVNGVEGSAYQLLMTLVAQGPQRSTTLAETTGVTASTISRQVAQLVDAGLVERRADPGDGRAALLVATDAGLAVYEQMRLRRQRAVGATVAGWPEEDVARLAELLGRFNDNAAVYRTSILEEHT